MVPVIAAGGASFQGAFQYYFHDKGAKTRGRVAWTETLNMLTDCVEKAWKVMAYTAKAQARLKVASGQKMTGAKLKKPVFAYSLSWHPEQKPSRDDMKEAALDSLKALGLDEHETMIAAHIDEPQPHVHIVVNTVHPCTGLVAKLKRTKRKLSDFAREYQRKEGTMYCPKREENHAKREAGNPTKYVDPVISKAWSESHDGKGFQFELEKSGYQLAQGRKRMVVVTPQGKAVNPVRELDGVRAKAFKDKVSDLKMEDLLTVDEAIAKISRAKGDGEKSHDSRADAIAEQKVEHINDQQTAQLAERSKMTSAHSRELAAKERELTDFYRFEEKRSKILELRELIERSGFFQKLIGLDRIRQRKLDRLEAGYSNGAMRFNEAINTLKNRQLAELSELESRHHEARVELGRSLEKWYPEKTAQRQRESSRRNYSLSRSNDGPALER